MQNGAIYCLGVRVHIVKVFSLFCVCVSPKPQVKGSGHFRDERGIKSGKGIPFVGSVFCIKLGTHMLIDLFFYIS